MEKLAKVLVDIGAPVLGGVIGGPAGAAATAVLKELAKELATDSEPEAIEKAIRERPDASQAVQGIEERMFNLWDKEAATIAALNKTEGEWSMFKDGWRSGLCWSLIVMWVWGLIFVPLVNGFGAKITATPIDSLLAFSTVVLTILGGGHTAKAIWGRK